MVLARRDARKAHRSEWPLMEYARWDPEWMLIHRPEFVKGQFCGAIQTLIGQNPQCALFYALLFALSMEYVDEAGRQFQRDVRDSEPDFGVMGHDQ